MNGIPWADYGLAGGVIFALFVFIRNGTNKFVSLMKEFHESHREERGEWLKSTNEVGGKMASAMDRLSEEIREMSTEKRIKDGIEKDRAATEAAAAKG